MKSIWRIGENTRIGNTTGDFTPGNFLTCIGMTFILVFTPLLTLATIVIFILWLLGIVPPGD